MELRKKLIVTKKDKFGNPITFKVRFEKRYLDNEKEYELTISYNHFYDTKGEDKVLLCLYNKNIETLTEFLNVMLNDENDKNKEYVKEKY